MKSPKCLVPGCPHARRRDGLCSRHLGESGDRQPVKAAKASAAVAGARALDRDIVAHSQIVTARQAWRALIADPTDENRAVFVAACERAR